MIKSVLILAFAIFFYIVRKVSEKHGYQTALKDFEKAQNKKNLEVQKKADAIEAKILAERATYAKNLPLNWPDSGFIKLLKSEDSNDDNLTSADLYTERD